MTITSIRWWDTYPRSGVVCVISSDVRRHNSKKTCRALLRNQMVKELDLCKWNGLEFCEFLIGMARFAGYEP